MKNAIFMKNIDIEKQIKGSEFETALKSLIEVKGRKMSAGMIILRSDIRSLKFYVEGFQASNFSLKDLKKYYKIAGNKHFCLYQLNCYLAYLSIHDQI